VSDVRIATVVRPLDRTLALLRVALVPLLAVSLSLPTLQSLTTSFASPPRDWILGLLGPALAIVYVVLLRTEVVGTRLNRAISGLRRQVALSCDHDFATSHDGGKLACLLTPEIFQAPRFPYQEQEHVLTALATACAEAQSEDSGQYWFLEGESGSGKTRTALLLVQKLVRDRKLAELSDRCYLYDLSQSKHVQDDLLTGLAARRHERAVVIVDNFQLVRSDVLSWLTGRLARDQSSMRECLMVFLTRQGDVWNLSLDHDVDLLSAAKESHHFLSLTGPRKETVVRYVADVDPEAATLVRTLSGDSSASATQLHLAQVIVRNRGTPTEVKTILQLLTGQPPIAITDDLTRILGLIAALAVHRGGFARRDLRTAIRRLYQDRMLESKAYSSVRLYAIFARLHRIGVISKIELGGTRYVFHEAIAELFVDRLWNVAGFREAFVAVGEVRLRSLASYEDALNAWLVAAEIGAQTELAASFDGAMANGGYQRMARCLRRASSRYELTSVTRLQLAILLHRTGELAESRGEFTKELLQALGSSEDLAIMLLTSRMEATHDAEAEEALGLLANSDRSSSALIGKYWNIHMDAHRGQFDSQALLEMEAQLLSMLGDGETYWLVYSLARIHFDSLRHLYLEGRASASAVSSDQREATYDYLRTRLATAEPLHALYTKAHLVAHILLPRLALFSESVNDDDAKAADLRHDERDDVDRIVQATQRLYRQTSDDFGQYGDREALYLKADLLNAEMIASDADLERVERLLREYTAFGAANFKSIASYPHLYWIRWHMLKYYEAAYKGLDPGAMDYHFAEAQSNLERVIELDTIAGNRYGLMRAGLLGVLLRAVRHQVDVASLTELERASAMQRYGVEMQLISYIKDKLTPGERIAQVDLRQAFRFYPFVHQ
jgi:hypothetical protein